MGKGTLFKVIFILNTGLLLLAVATIFISANYFFFSPSINPELKRELRNSYLEPILKKVDISYLFFDIKNADLPIYDIVISPKNYRKLVDKIPQKIANPSFEFPYVKARFIHQGKEHDVKVKFRGLLDNHWINQQKSWRINFKKDNLFKGIDKLNLIIPSDRNFLKEALSYYTAKKLGLVVPRHEFALLRVNSEFHGVYFGVEQMGKEFLARASRPDTGNLYNGQSDSLTQNIYENITLWEKYQSDGLTPFDNFAHIDLLLKLLKAPDQEFYKKIENGVDVDNLLRWHVNSLLYFDYHQDNFHNNRLYFSPVTGRFEFLVWDCSHPVYNEQVDKTYNDLVSRILMNPEYLNKRNNILWQYVKNDSNLKDDLAYFDKLTQQTRNAFLADSKKDISNIKYLYASKSTRADIPKFYETLKSRLREASVSGNIYFNRSSSGVLAKIDLFSDGFSSPELHEIIITSSHPKEKFYLHYDKNGNHRFDEADQLIGMFGEQKDAVSYLKNINFILHSNRVMKDGFLNSTPTGYTFFVSKNRGKAVLKELSMKTLNSVTGEPITPSVRFVDEETFKYFDDMAASSLSLIEKFPFLKQARNPNVVSVGPGEVDVKSTLIIPKTATLIVNPGTILNIYPQVSIIGYGELISMGTKDKPIHFRAKYTKKPWGVLGMVGQSQSEFRMAHTHFQDASEAHINGVTFTGALSVHGFKNSQILDSVFKNNHGDDGLNVKYGNVIIDSSSFIHNDFDGLDLDFSTGGSVKNCKFSSNGNDNLDLGSVTDVGIMNNSIEFSKDKNISMGEGSKLLIFNNQIRGGTIGIAIKDMSQAVIINNDIVENNIGISLYNKKPVWETGGEATIYNTILNNKKDVEALSGSKFKIHSSIVKDSQYGDQTNFIVEDWRADHREYRGDPDVLKKYLSELNLPAILPIGRLQNVR